MSVAQTVRDENLAYLNSNGFQPATWMPLPNEVGAAAEPGFGGGVLRPVREIVERYCCHCAVFAWGSAPAEFENAIREFVDGNELRKCMTNDERKICEIPKDVVVDKFGNSVGWRLENMWSLAWVLGLADEPSSTTGQLPEEASGALLAHFLPEFKVTIDSLMEDSNVQSIEDVIRTEDRFYLAHNAVRSAQTGEAGVVPDDFDPVGDGGAIHERRHALTWVLSPGTSWNDTDLST